MDLQKSGKRGGEAQGGYQSYGSGGARPGADEAAARDLEREMVLMEYETDRDVILKTIKDALKRHDYDDAQAFVYKYRAAAKQDEEFSILAKLLAQKLESKQKIDKIKTLIEATDEKDTKALIALNERILRIDPDNEEAKTALAALLGEDECPKPKKKKRSKKALEKRAENAMHPGLATVLLALACMFWWLMALAMSMTAFNESFYFSGIYGALLFIPYTYWFCPYKKNKTTLSWGSYFSRIGLSFCLLLVFFFFYI